MLTESSSGHTALSSGLSFQTKSPSYDFPTFYKYSLKTLLKVCCGYIQMVKCSQLGSGDEQAAHPFCKAEKAPGEGQSQTGQSLSSSCKQSIPFTQSDLLLSEERAQMFTEESGFPDNM